MLPVIFHIGPIPLNSFGLMMVCAFLAGWRCLYLSLERAGKNPALAERMVLYAVAGGIVGARLNFIVSFPEELIARPLSTLFGGAGFVFYGGFIGGLLAVWYLLRRERMNFLDFADITAPCLALGYAIGRIGCQLSGDGDYGIPSDLPWAMSYELGVVPTPPGVRVHPAPVYETLSGLAITAALLVLQRRKTFSGRGQLFGVYLALSAASRFAVEFIRIEPVIYAGLTQAQLVAVAMALLGLTLFVLPSRRMRTA